MPIHTHHTRNSSPQKPSFPLSLSSLPLQPSKMNATITTLKHIICLPFSLLTALPRPNFSYIPATHIKLKADSVAMVLLCLVRHAWMYVQGWSDSRLRRGKFEKGSKRSEKGAQKKDKRRKGRVVGKARERGKRYKVVARGRYTLILQ
jgi:hypothetical protein